MNLSCTVSTIIVHHLWARSNGGHFEYYAPSGHNLYLENNSVAIHYMKFKSLSFIEVVLLDGVTFKIWTNVTYDWKLVQSSITHETITPVDDYDRTMKSMGFK